MMLSAVLPVILLLPLAYGYNYCNNRTHRCILENNVHFMCKLDKIPSLGGTRYYAVAPDTPNLRSEILQIINHFRNQFAGGGFRTKKNMTFAPARRLRQVMWDSELAYMARAHASTVSFKHTLCRSTLRFPEVGECLSMMVPKYKHTLREALHKLFKLMFDEHLNIKDPDALLEGFHPIRDYICAHFTIFISDRVSRVGCGVAVGTNCRQGSTSNFCYFLTCHFDFDNVNGSYVYKAAPYKFEVMMIGRFLVPLILLLPMASGYNYCNNKTHKCVLENKKHFMCHLQDFPIYGNDTKFFASVPNNLRMQRIVLDILNQKRNEFAGGELTTKGNKKFARARRMRRLLWDKELAYMGHNHASTLSLMPSPCRSTLRFPHVGEAIALVTRREKVNLKEIYSMAFNSMFAEYRDVVDPDGLLQAFEPTRDSKVHYFTNLISDRVSRVGCGIAVGSDCHPSFKFCHFVTCYFDFSNLAGSYVYKAGDPTSSCDDWGVVSSDKFANLCKNSGEIFPHDQGDRVE